LENLARIGPGNGDEDDEEENDLFTLRDSVETGIESLIHAMAPFRNITGMQEQQHKSFYFKLDADEINEFHEDLHDRLVRFGPSVNITAIRDKTLFRDVINALIELETLLRQKQREYEAMEGGRRRTRSSRSRRARQTLSARSQSSRQTRNYRSRRARQTRS